MDNVNGTPKRENAGEGQPPDTNRGVVPPHGVDGLVHIDWFAGTYDTDGLIASYPDMAAIWRSIESQEGHLVKDANRNGYTGARCGSVFWGIRPDGSFREMGGVAARAYTESGVQEIRLVRATRLDIAYTFRTEEYNPNIAKEIFADGPQNKTGTGPPRKRVFYENSDGGSTVYIGAPSSEVRIRVYDKHAERQYSDAYARCWRVELQLRGEKARMVWHAYHTASHKPGYLVDLIEGQCEREAMLRDYIVGGMPVGLPPTPANNQRVIERLHWLERQVSPTVRELNAMGYADEVLQALGLTKSE